MSNVAVLGAFCPFGAYIREGIKIRRLESGGRRLYMSDGHMPVNMQVSMYVVAGLYLDPCISTAPTVSDERLLTQRK